MLEAPRFLRLDEDLLVVWVALHDLALSDRVFACGGCGLIADRDTNSAANLAAWGENESSSLTQAPDPEARAGSPKPVEGGALLSPR